MFEYFFFCVCKYIMSFLLQPDKGVSKSGEIKFLEQGLIREVHHYKDRIQDVLKNISNKRELADEKKVKTKKIYPNLDNSGNKVADFLSKGKSTDLNFVRQGVEEVIFAARQAKLDDRLTTSVVGGHGVLTLGNFIVIPKNTIIITFVNDGRLHLDTKVSGGKLDMVEWYHFVYLWIENLVEIVKIFGDNVSADLIKEYMQHFVKNKMKLLNKYKKMNVHEYWLINNDIVMYTENDVIPEQQIAFYDADFAGIHEWQTELTNYVEMTEYMNQMKGAYDRKKFHYFQTYKDSLHIFSGIENSNAVEYEQRGSVKVPSTLLSNLLDFMETKRQNKNVTRPNIIILSACRGLNGDLITVKPHVSFLYKNIFYQFDYLLNNKKLISSVNKSKFEDYVYSEVQKLYNRYRNKSFQDIEGLFDIFYKKICLLGTKKGIKRVVTLFYEDAKVATDKITDDVLEVHVPARDGNGEMINTKMQSLPFEKNWFNVVNFVNSNPENMFYVPKNSNSKFVLDVMQIDNLDISPLQNRTEFWNLESRRKIFQQWEQSMNKYIHQHFKKTHIEIMRLLFVDLKRMDSPDVFELAQKSLAPFVYFKLFLYDPNRQNNFQLFYVNQVSEEIIYALIYYKKKGINERNNEFITHYKSDIIRDLSFPYLTPVEFALANYSFDSTSIAESHFSFLDLAKKLWNTGEYTTEDASVFVYNPNFFSPEIKKRYFICNYVPVYDSLQLLERLFKNVVASLMNQSQGRTDIEPKNIQQIQFRYTFPGGEVGPELNQVDFFQLYFFMVWYQQIFVGFARYQPKKVVQLPSALIFYLDEVLSSYSKYNLLDVHYTEDVMNDNLMITKNEAEMEQVLYSLKHYFVEAPEETTGAKALPTSEVVTSDNETLVDSAKGKAFDFNLESLGFLTDDFKRRCREADMESLKLLIRQKLEQVRTVFDVRDVPKLQQRKIVLELYGYFETIDKFSVYVFFFEGLIEMIPKNMYIYTFITRYFTNYFLLETDREYEMWMFPVVGESIVYDSVSFPFKKEGADSLKKSFYASRNFLIFYLIMLDFFGFTMVDGLSGELIADPGSRSIERTVHLLSKAANVKKLIRIIVSLFFCGFRLYATSLNNRMKHYVNDVAKVSDDPVKVREYFLKISNYVTNINNVANYRKNILLLNIDFNFDYSTVPIIVNFNNIKYNI